MAQVTASGDRTGQEEVGWVAIHGELCSFEASHEGPEILVQDWMLSRAPGFVEGSRGDPHAIEALPDFRTLGDPLRLGSIIQALLEILDLGGEHPHGRPDLLGRQVRKIRREGRYAIRDPPQLRLASERAEQEREE